MTPRRLLVLALVAVTLLLLRIGLNRAGYRLNNTASMPYGIWHVDPPPARLERGMIVVVCLPSNEIEKMAVARRYIGSGDCATGTEPLLKPISALPGDTVSVTADGIAINGSLLPNSVAKPKDAAGRTLFGVPAGDYRVEHGYWTIAPYPGSFDSRYLGWLPLTSIVGTATPVLTWQ